MSDFNNVVFPRKLTTKFIEKFKELRCLWDRDDDNYRIKMKKHAALSQLTDLVQEHDPNATRVHVLRKIDSLRACVRREYKKVQDSKRNATSEEEVYQPNLWYYNLFAFVFDNEAPLVKKQKTDSSEGEEEEHDEPVENDQVETFEVEPYQADYNIPLNVVEMDRASTSMKIAIPVQDSELNKNKKSRTAIEVDDEYDAIGINVAAKLRFLPSNMRILSEKLINDVLFQAQVNGLNSSTKIVTTDPFKQETTSPQCRKITLSYPE